MNKQNASKKMIITPTRAGKGYLRPGFMVSSSSARRVDIDSTVDLWDSEDEHGAH